MGNRRDYLKQCSHMRVIARKILATHPERAFNVLDTAFRVCIRQVREWEDKRRATLPKERKP